MSAQIRTINRHSPARATMDPASPNAFREWLEQKKKERATRFTVCRQAEEVRGSMMRSFAWEEVDCDSHKLAIEILRRTEQEAICLPGAKHAYCVQAFREQEYLDRYVYCVAGDGPEHPDALPAVNDQQVNGALLEHSRLGVEFALGHTNAIVNLYKEQVTEWKARCGDLEEQIYLLNKDKNEFEAAKHEREMDRKRQEEESNRANVGIQLLMQSAPMLLQMAANLIRPAAPALPPASPAKAAGAPNATAANANGTETVEPAGVTLTKEEAETLRSLLVSITEEQMAALGGTLTPQQIKWIWDLYVAFGKRDIAQQEAAKKNDASGDAAGVAAA